MADGRRVLTLVVRFAALVAVAALLGGCAGAPAPVDQYFRLIPAAPARLGEPALAGTLVVRRFTADALLAQRPVAYAHSDVPQELYQYNYHFWTDSPTVMLQQLTARVLREAGVAPRVVTPEQGVDADFALTGRIERLEHLVGEPGAGAVALELAVLDERHGKLVCLHQYRETIPAAAPGVEAAVGAMNEAVTRILASFVSDLATR